MKRLRTLLALLALSVTLAACAHGGAIDPAVLSPPAASAATAPTEPAPVVLPRDDEPHADLTEWWYYTGHLQGPAGQTYGFEFVIFQAVRSDDPPAYAAHFAVTDVGRDGFRFSERGETGAQVKAGPGLDLALSGWTLQGADGRFHVRADMDSYAVDLTLDSLKPAVLHDGKGLISFGPAGNSYYYSRTRLGVTGTFVDHAESLPVTGQAWMDHQWGNFVSGGGGWDWFSIQLDDKSEVMLFFLRDDTGKLTYPYGTYVDPNGSAMTLAPSAFDERPTGSWISPTTGTTYPSGWQVSAGDLRLSLTPTVKDQELATTKTTGVTYWEGDVTIAGTHAGRPVHGQGYVELVGYPFRSR